MRQTIKFAGIRASQDPDRSTDTPGIYYGLNVSHKIGGAYNVPLLANNRMFMRAPVKR